MRESFEPLRAVRNRTTHFFHVTQENLSEMSTYTRALIRAAVPVPTFVYPTARTDRLIVRRHGQILSVPIVFGVSPQAFLGPRLCNACRQVPIPLHIGQAVFAPLAVVRVKYLLRLLLRNRGLLAAPVLQHGHVHLVGRVGHCWSIGV